VLFRSIVGRVMKASKGQADGKVVSAIMQSRRGS
jgi:Asp-tRNA(Asn)/Glu-tRNA(Gln) amidotransferase B subunit